MARLKTLSDEIKECGTELNVLEEKQKTLLLSIPNIPNQSVPVGKDDTENKEIRRWREPTVFSFEPKAHWDIGKALNILDPETAAKVTGARFHFYKGLGARLERSIINFFLNTHTENGYTEILPPFMANRASMTGTGQLPKFEEDAFKLATKVSNEDYFLIPRRKCRSPICIGMKFWTGQNSLSNTAHIPLASVRKQVPLDETPAALSANTSLIRWSL